MKLKAKLDVVAQKCLCADTIGHYILKGNNYVSYKVMCVSIVDLAMGMLEIEEIPNIVNVDKIGATDMVFDKMSKQMRRLV